MSPELRDPEQSIGILPGVISCKIREIPVLTRGCSCEEEIDTVATLRIRAAVPVAIFDRVVFSSRGLRTARPTVWKRWPATRDDALAFAASWDHVLKAEELAVSLARERGLLRSPLPRLRWCMLRTASW